MVLSGGGGGGGRRRHGTHKITGIELYVRCILNAVIVTVEPPSKGHIIIIRAFCITERLSSL